MDVINYAIPADVLVVGQPGLFVDHQSGAVHRFRGRLDKAVEFVMTELSPEFLASVVIRTEDGQWYRLAEIETIYSRADFPGRTGTAGAD